MQERQYFSKRLILVVSLVAMGLGGLWVWNNKWDIYDRWAARGYVATKDSSEVLNNLELTPRGNLAYRASQTEVDNKDNFRDRCPTQDYEQASVLGCYWARRIYVLRVDEPRLSGVEEVTAAHELLHAKFERMSTKDKAEVEKLLKELRNTVKDGEVNNLVANYKKSLGEGEALDNEIFAIYGTQIEDLNPKLESIYAEYFKDRKKIVSMYKSYSSEFQRAAAIVGEYDAKLAKLKAEKDELEAEIESLGAELNAQKVELDQLKNSDSSEEYQRAAQAYNAKVGVYNAKVERIREVIAQYNALVEKRNSEALSAKSLADKLNANVEER